MAEIVERFELSEKERTNLGGVVCEVLDDLDTAHAQLFQDIDVWWDWVEAVPQYKVKSEPWHGASNVVIPVIRAQGDGQIAQHYAEIFSHGRIWTGRAQNELVKDLVPSWLEFINWAADDNEFELQGPVLDWLTEIIYLGTGVLGLRWDHRERYVRLPGADHRPRRVTVHRGPVVEHIPRERILWTPGLGINDADVLAKQAWQTPTALVRMGQMDGFYPEAVAEALKHPDSDSPARTIRESKDRREGISRSAIEASSADHDLREVWVDAPLVRAMNVSIGGQNSKQRSVPLTITLHRSARKILRAIPEPYGLGRKPFYAVHLGKRVGRASGQGLAKRLEHFQRAITTVVNQTIDAVTLANSVSFKTTDAGIYNKRFSPNKPILLNTMGDLEPFGLPKQVFPDIAIVNLLQAFGERVGGTTDPLIGRESRSGGHPSPATNFLGMLQQSQALQSPLRAGVRRALSQLGEDILHMYQLFETDSNGRLMRILGPKDGNAVRNLLFNPELPVIGSIALDLHAMDELRNPEAEQKKAVLLSQMTTNTYAQVIPLLQQLANPEAGPETKEAIQTAVKATLNSFERFLVAVDIDDPDEFLLELDNRRTQDAGNLQQFTQLLSNAGGDQGAVPGAGMANPGLASGAPQGGAGAAFDLSAMQ